MVLRVGGGAVVGCVVVGVVNGSGVDGGCGGVGPRGRAINIASVGNVVIGVLTGCRTALPAAYGRCMGIMDVCVCVLPVYA